MRKINIAYRLEVGAGAGVNIQPVGFLVITENSAKMLPVNHCSAIDKLLDYVPDLLDKISEIWGSEKTYTYEFYEDEDGCSKGTCTCKCDDDEDSDEEE